MSIADSISEATAYLREHRDEARYRDSEARATLAGGLAVTVEGPNGATARTDMPVSVGGGDTAPSPGWLLRAAEASCVTTLIAMRAAMLGIELRGVEVTVDSQSDDYGILGIDDAVPAGPLSTKVAVVIDAPGSNGGQLESLVQWAVAHCPVTDAVARAVPIDLEVRPANR